VHFSPTNAVSAENNLSTHTHTHTYLLNHNVRTYDWEPYL